MEGIEYWNGGAGVTHCRVSVTGGLHSVSVGSVTVSVWPVSAPGVSVTVIRGVIPPVSRHR